jgi:hypothetical protein
MNMSESNRNHCATDELKAHSWNSRSSAREALDRLLQAASQRRSLFSRATNHEN